MRWLGAEEQRVEFGFEQQLRLASCDLALLCKATARGASCRLVLAMWRALAVTGVVCGATGFAAGFRSAETLYADDRAKELLTKRLKVVFGLAAAALLAVGVFVAAVRGEPKRIKIVKK